MYDTFAAKIHDLYYTNHQRKTKPKKEKNPAGGGYHQNISKFVLHQISNSSNG